MYLHTHTVVFWGFLHFNTVYVCLCRCVCVCARVYHPEHHVDGEDSGHPSERQALQDAAARVQVVTSLSRAVLFPERVQEAGQIRLSGPPLHRGRCRHKWVRMLHQHKTRICRETQEAAL